MLCNITYSDVLHVAISDVSPELGTSFFRSSRVRSCSQVETSCACSCTLFWTLNFSLLPSRFALPHSLIFVRALHAHCFLSRSCVYKYNINSKEIITKTGAREGQPEQDKQNGIARIRQPETREPERDGQNGTARTGQRERDSQNGTARKDSQNGAARAGQPDRIR
jgi:hypothetical protein